MQRKASGRVDRRVLRTREKLRRALVALVGRKGYEAITISDICAEADLGRSTFYAHFATKADLRRKCMEAHLRELIGEGKAGADSPPSNLAFGLRLFEHAREYAALHKGRLDHRTDGVFKQVLADCVREELSSNVVEGRPAGLQREFAVQYIAGAYAAVLHWWLERGGELSPEQAQHMFRSLAMDGLAAATTDRV